MLPSAGSGYYRSTTTSGGAVKRLPSLVLLRENERITGPVAQPNPSGVGPVDVDPQDPVTPLTYTATLE